MIVTSLSVLLANPVPPHSSDMYFYSSELSFETIKVKLGTGRGVKSKRILALE